MERKVDLGRKAFLDPNLGRCQGLSQGLDQDLNQDQGLAQNREADLGQGQRASLCQGASRGQGANQDLRVSLDREVAVLEVDREVISKQRRKKLSKKHLVEIPTMKAVRRKKKVLLLWLQCLQTMSLALPRLKLQIFSHLQPKILRLEPPRGKRKRPIPTATMTSVGTPRRTGEIGEG